MTEQADRFCEMIEEIFGPSPVPLHRPVFEGNETRYLANCIRSNFVSSVGARVTEFEERLAAFTGRRFAIATVNGTAALHLSLQVAGVERGDEVISQALTFIATCNAISYLGATPVFVDVEAERMGMCPDALSRWLDAHAERRSDGCYNRDSGARIAACVPMHTFGIPVRADEIAAICVDWGIALVEDAAESLGSYEGGRHTGTHGLLAAISFNGNKIITTGGGGMIVTDDARIAARAKHLSTTAKQPHSYEFVHDDVGYNYRLPNLNAALGCAQMETLPEMLRIKAELATRYARSLPAIGLDFVTDPVGTRPNHWLNAVRLPDRAARDAFLQATNARGVMTRPVWTLMNALPMFAACRHDGLETSRWLADRIVNIPSSVPEADFTRLTA